MSNSDITLIIKAINEAKSALASVKGDLKSFESSVSGAENTTKKFNSTQEASLKQFSNWASTIRNFVAGGVLAKMSQGLLNVSGQLEMQESAFKVLLGGAEQARAKLAELSEFAKATPFTIPGIRETAKQMLAYGIEQDKLIPTMRMLGDLALGNEEKFGRLAYAYGQVRAAGRLYGTELRQFTETGIPIIAALAAEFGVAESEIKGMVESGQVGFVDLQNALSSLTEEGGQFFGLMEEGSQTFLGMLSNLKDGATQFLETFRYTEGFDVLKELTQDMLDLTSETGTAREVFKDFTNGLIIGFLSVGNVISTVTGGIKTLKDGAVAVFKTYSDIKQIVQGSPIEMAKELFTGADPKDAFEKYKNGIKTGLVGIQSNAKEFVSSTQDNFGGMLKTLEVNNERVQRLMVDMKNSLKIPTSDGAGGGSLGVPPFGDLTGGADKAAEKIENSIDKILDDYADLRFKAGLEVVKLTQSHEKEVQKIVAEFQKLRVELGKVEEAYRDDLGETNRTMAEAFVEQEELVADLRKKLKDAQKEGAGTKELEAELKKQEEALKSFSETYVAENEKVKKIKDEIAGLEDQLGRTSRMRENSDVREGIESQISDKKKQIEALIAAEGGLNKEVEEARRRAALTEFERFLEDSELKKEELKSRYEEEKNEILDKLKAEQDALTEENQIYEDKKKNYREAFDEFERMKSGLIAGNGVMVENTAETVEDLTEYYAQLKQQLDLIRAATAPKDRPDNRTDADVFAQTGVVAPFPVDSFTPRSGNNAGASSTSNNTNNININISRIDSPERVGAIESATARALQLNKMYST